MTAHALPELTLIVAATQQMGIGLNGTLPWTGLRREMAYFARVTKRVMSPLPQQQQQQQQNPTNSPSVQEPSGVQNAVIMGRKTWESIPKRFRPLPGRVNVVVSRSWAATNTGSDASGAVVAGSLEEALRYLGERQRQQSEANASQQQAGEGQGAAGGEVGVGRVFVIGGAQIYGAALGLREARRVLLTRVRSEFECDTFFPLRLQEGAGTEGAGEKGWRRSGQAEMDAWVGEEVPRGAQTEGGTEYEFEMWERVD